MSFWKKCKFHHYTVLYLHEGLTKGKMTK